MFDSIAKLDRIQRQLDRWLPEEKLDELEAAEPEDSQTEERGPDFGTLPLLDFVPTLTPAFKSPRHLTGLVEMLEAAIRPHKGQQFFWYSVPPRHFKTSTLCHAAAKHLKVHPSQFVAYISHTAPFSAAQSRFVKRLVRRMGLDISREINRQDEWEIDGYSGGLIARGVGSEITGRGARLIILDDIIKGRQTAHSPADRERIWHSVQEDVLPRLTPDGTAIVVHTRWHPDDPIGRAIHQGWDGQNVPALNDSDEALLEEVWPAEVLRKIRSVNPAKFSALYQGKPQLPGSKIFREPSYYDWVLEKPTGSYAVGHGVDLAFTEKTRGRGDWSVVVTIKRFDSPEQDPAKARYYVTNVVRKQVDAPSFALTLHSTQKRDGGPMRWYFAGGEKGAGQFIAQKVDSFEMRPATADKGIRAEPVAEAWNNGQVLVPGGEGRPNWVDDFVDEIVSFTGVKDPNDDQVDALAAAFDLVNLETYDGGVILIPRNE